MVTSDELLFAFMIPLLPTVLEHRIGLEPSLTQKYTSIFLAEGAFVSVVSSPFIGAIADAVSSKKTLFLVLLALTLVSTACLSLTSQRMYCSFQLLIPGSKIKIDGMCSDMAFCRSVFSMHH